MKKKLFPIVLTTDAKKVILSSLENLFDLVYRRKSALRLAELIIDVSKAAKDGDKLFLSSGDWLLILSSLMLKFQSLSEYDDLLRFSILGIALRICIALHAEEGEICYSFKQFRFFVCKR